MEGDTSEDNEGQSKETTKKKEQYKEEISDELFPVLLYEISQWFDHVASISMLKVLYRDHVTGAESFSDMRTLLDNLYIHGYLSAKNLSILHDTINVTKLFGFEPENKNLLLLFKDVKKHVITNFTWHRQRLISFGMALNQDGVEKLDNVLNVPLKKYEDSWRLIDNLEDRQIICEGKMEQFIEKLNYLELYLAVKALTSEDIGNSSSNSRQLNDEEKKIREHLLTTQQRVCRNLNRFTPAIWNTKFYVNIEYMFTEMDLLKESKTDTNQECKLTTLEEVLSNIKSTHACKALIEGEGGIGKSTLLRYVAYNWATKKSDETFKDKIVFLVNFSDINDGETIIGTIMKRIDLESFSLQTKLQKDPELIKRFIVNHNDEIVLLLDGLDELRVGSENPIKFFNREKMEYSKVILTTRPGNIYEFIEESDIHVQVKGFSPSNIKNYIMKHFEHFRKPKLGQLLISELNIDAEYISDRGASHPEVYSMCTNPMLLLLICSIWEENKSLPADKSDLFKKIFVSILNQYIDKQAESMQNTLTFKGMQKISTFERIPGEFVIAMVLLGKCMYEGLKANKLSLNKNDLEGKQETVCLALKLGFVYKDSPSLTTDFEWIFTAPHKLIVESLVGFYLSKLFPTAGLENQFSEDMKKLLNPLGENEWQIIRRSEHFHMSKVFTIGFLNADAGNFLNHWITNNISTYRSLMMYLRFVKKEHRSTVEKALINHMKKTDLEIKPYIYGISNSLRKFICHLTSDVEVSQNEHFIQLMGRIYSLNIKVADINCFCRNMSPDEKGRMLAHILIAVQNQGPILRELSSICVDDDIKYLETMCQKLYFKYDDIEPPWSYDSFSFRPLVHLLCNTQLQNLTLFLRNTHIDDVLRNVHSIGVNLKLREISLKCDLSTTDSCLFASVFLNPTLKSLALSSCRISGFFMNDIIEHCFRRGVKLRSCNLSENNLSNMDIPLFASFIATSELKQLLLGRCKLSGGMMNIIIGEFVSKGVKLSGAFTVADNDIGDIDSSAFASLLYVASELYLKNCNISSDIMNNAMEECCRKGIKFEPKCLDLNQNNLSNIDSFLFASFCVFYKPKRLCMEQCSGSAVKRKYSDGSRSCIIIGDKSITFYPWL